MDKVKSKIIIYGNSDEIYKFLNTIDINNYSFTKEMLLSRRKTEFDMELLNTLFKNKTYADVEVNVDESDILILNFEEISDKFKEYLVSYDLKNIYDVVFAYGSNMENVAVNYDMWFDNFEDFKEFFEIFYYMNNSVEVVSLDFYDIKSLLGEKLNKVISYKAYNFIDVKEFLQKNKSQIDSMFYVEKTTNEKFDFFKFSDRVDWIIEFAMHNGINILYTTLISEENDETWTKVFIKCR